MAKNVIEMVLKLDDKKAEKKLKKIGAVAKKTAVAAGKLSAGMLAAGAAVGGFVQKMADAQNQLTDMSARTGVATSTLAGLKFAAEGSGQSLETMERMLYGLVNRLQTAKKGSKEAAEGFSDLGIEITDSEGNLRSTDKILREVTTSLAAIDDPTNRAAAAVAALGMQGSRMIQALGNTDLQSFVDLTNEFGMDTGPQAVAAAAEWQRAVAALKAVTQPFSAELINMSTSMVTNFTLGAVYLKAVYSDAFADIKDSMKGLWSDIQSQLDKIRASLSEKYGGNRGLIQSFIETNAPILGGVMALAKGPAARPAHPGTAEVMGVRDSAFADRGGSPAEEKARRFFELSKKIAAQAAAAVAPIQAMTKKIEETGDAAAEASKKIESLPWLDAQFAAAATPMLDRYKESVKAMHADMMADIGAQLERDAQQQADRISNIQGTFGTIGALAAPTTSNIGGMIGMAAGGPAGAAVGQGIGELIASVDQFDENMESFFGDILGFLKDAPTAILRVISEVIPTFIGEFIPALIEMIPKMVIGLVVALGEMLKNLLKAIGNWINPFKSNKQRAPGDQRTWWERTKDWATGSKPEGFAAGGFVNQTGMSMVHQGERIIPASGAGTGTATNMMGGGSGVSVTVNGIVSPQLIDDLVRELNVALGPRGRGLALGGF